ncbi:MAG: exosortase/archaeosortase family protein [Planctomycetota bacterium]
MRSHEQVPSARAPFGAALVRGDWTAAALAITLSVPLLVLFWTFIDRQLGISFEPFGWQGGTSWVKPEDWGHSYLVPLISAYYVWLHRDKIQRATTTVFWPGVLPLLLGVLCYFYFTIIFSNHMFQGAAFALTLSGVVLTLLGPRVFALLFFPIAFLMLGVTVSEAVMIQLTFKLQQIAAAGSFVMLNIVGIETQLIGNQLHPIDPFSGDALPPLNVAEACSGMRMVIAFVALSTAFAFFGCTEWWQRISVISLGVPVAIFMNVIRVALLGVLSLIDPELAGGQAHMVIGMILLVPSFLLFMGCVWVLQRIITPADPSAEESTAT